MAHIFISYTKRDVALCETVTARLRAMGYSVWWDDDLPSGRDYSVALEERLRSADAVVTLWTRRSVNSKWVYFETLMASGMHKAVPLRLDDCEIPHGLHLLQTYAIDPAWPPDDKRWEGVDRRVREAIAHGRAAAHMPESLDDLAWDTIRSSRDVEDFEDFLERYPNSRHGPAARDALAERRRKRLSRTLLLWSLGLLTYGALLAPFMTLHLDYEPSDAWFLASLYFPFFGFFPIFGAVMVPIFWFTWIKAFRFGWARGLGLGRGPLAAKISTIALLVVAPLTFCTAIAAIEVSDGYAPWEFRAGVLQTRVSMLAAGLEVQTQRPSAHDEDRSPLDIFKAVELQDLTSLWSARNADVETVPCLASPTDPTRPDPRCLEHMNALQSVMEHYRAQPENRSYTAAAYRFGFFFFALAFIGTYFNIFALTVRPDEARLWMARLSPWSGQRYAQLLQLFAIQLFLISIWFVSRMIFQLETQTILPSSGGEQFTQAIRNNYFFFFSVYLVAIGYVIAAALRLKGPLVRLGIVVLAVFTAAFIGLAFSVTWFCRALQNTIGVHANPASFIVLAIVLVFIVVIPLVLPNILPKREDAL